MKNKQNGFSEIVLILVGLAIIGIAWLYMSPQKNTLNFQEDVLNTTETATTTQGDRSTYGSQEEMIAGRTATEAHYNYIEKGVVPNGWTKKEIKMRDDKFLTFILPSQYADVISYELINKEIDAVPENFALSTIGGAVSDMKKYNLYAGGMDEIKVIEYSFVTSTNSKWKMMEVKIGESSHIEIGYSYKTELDKPKISLAELNKIATSIKIE